MTSTRSRRLVALAATCGLLAAVPAPGPAAAAAPSGSCDPAHHTVTITSGGHRRIVRHLRTVASATRIWVARTPRSFGSEFFSCWVPRHRAVRVCANSSGAATTDAVCDEFTAVGDYVAFHVGASGDENDDSFASFDARSGRFRYKTGLLPRRDQRNTATQLALTTTGAIAYLHQGVLEARDAAGSRQLADEAAGPITALRGNGRTVVWSQGGQRHTARLR
jgi:hypothetical protein